MEPSKHPNLSLDEYVDQLESTLKPTGFDGIAKRIFEQVTHEPKESISTFWEKVNIHWKEAKITDVVQFKETFLKGLANQDVITLKPNTPDPERTG